MLEYMRTVLNGLKAWVTGEVNKLLSKIDNDIGAVASRASNAATKNKNAIESLNKKLNSVANGVNEAQSTAETAQNTAEAAKSKADNAFVKAQAAENTADAAIVQLNYDNGHFYTRSDIKTPLTLRSIRSIGMFMFYDYTLGGYIIASATWGDKSFIRGVVLEKAVHYISSDSHTNLDDTTFTLEVHQVPNIILESSTGSSKKFKITVDDTGTLTATEVTTS